MGADTEHQLTSTLHSLQTTTMVDASNTNGSNGVVTDIVVNNDHPVDTSPSPNGKIPSSITRVYDIPVVKGTVDYADSLIRSLPLAGAAYVKAESIASTVYKKAGEPLQEKLQPQIEQLDGLANKTLDYVQGKAPFLVEAKPDELVANAKKPADQAYSTAKTYQDLVYNRLHETLLNSQKTLSGLQERLAGVVGSATATIPKNSEEINKLASQLYESLEGVKEAVLKQSHDFPHMCQRPSSLTLRSCRRAPATFLPSSPRRTSRSTPKPRRSLALPRRSAPNHSTTPSRRSGPSSTTTRSRSRAPRRTARTEPSLPRNSSRNTLRAMSAMLRRSRSRRRATLRPFTRAATLHSAKRSVADPHIRRDGSPRRSDHLHPTTQSVRTLIHGLVPGSNATSGSPVSGKISPTQTERSDPPSPSRVDTL